MWIQPNTVQKHKNVNTFIVLWLRNSFEEKRIKEKWIMKKYERMKKNS